MYNSLLVAPDVEQVEQSLLSHPDWWIHSANSFVLDMAAVMYFRMHNGNGKHPENIRSGQKKHLEWGGERWTATIKLVGSSVWGITNPYSVRETNELRRTRTTERGSFVSVNFCLVGKKCWWVPDASTLRHQVKLKFAFTKALVSHDIKINSNVFSCNSK